MSKKWYEEDIDIDGAAILSFFKRNIRIISITLGIIILLSVSIGLFVKYFELPIKEGTIKEKIYDGEHVAYLQDTKSVQRLEYYRTTESYTNADGSTGYRTVQASRWVHDHYEYCVEKHTDGEDFIIFITSPSNKIEGKILTRYIYVATEIFSKYEKRDYFIADFKERNETTRDRNNKIERVTAWTRQELSGTEMGVWKEKEY